MKLIISAILMCSALVLAFSSAMADTSTVHKSKSSQPVRNKPSQSDNAQLSSLKSLVKSFDVETVRLNDDIKRHDHEQALYDQQAADAQQFTLQAQSADSPDAAQAYVDKTKLCLSTENDIIDRVKRISQDEKDDTQLIVSLYKQIHNNPLFQRKCIESDHVFPENFCPEGFNQDDLDKIRNIDFR